MSPSRVMLKRSFAARPSRLFRCTLSLVGLVLLLAASHGLAGEPPRASSLSVYPPAVSLESSRDFQGLAVYATGPDGVAADVTSKAAFSLSDPSLAKLDGHTLKPLADGDGKLVVRFEDQSVEVPLKVRQAAVDRPVSFRLDVEPVFLKAGCNTGGCHGSARGKDGFMLSLFGFDPDGDYDRITRAQGSRRINLALPEESLLVTKSVGQVQHTGGELFKKDSALYDAMLRWLRAGAPRDSADVATPVALELFPPKVLLQGGGGTQQLVARARYSDGTDRDVTSLAVFQTNNESSAAIDPSGKITAKARGEAFITARFATFTVGCQALVVPSDLAFTWPDTPAFNYVDEGVYNKLKALRIAPSEVCTDAVFARRLYLDVIGKLPTAEELNAFCSDTASNKREALVDALLARPEFVDLWVMKFAELLKIRSNDNQQVTYKAVYLYFNWLKEQFAANVPMDELVKKLIDCEGGTLETPQTNYYQIERDPLKLAEDTAQVFMGMRIQCSQCHNHPFDRWTMDDYYGFASFFSQVGRKAAEDPRETVVFDRGGGEVNHPLGRKMKPKFLGGDVADIPAGADRRHVLAEWLASPKNPYFAKNLANIVWAHYMGRGIIEPVDDVRISNPAVNPELLDSLATHFQDYRYDFRKLVRDICTSRTYQLATAANDGNASDIRNFAKGPIRRIRAEVLLDVIGQVTESVEKLRGLPLGSRAVQIADGATNNYFLTTFGRAKRETVCTCEVAMEPNLSQALHLLNGQTTNGKILDGGVVRRMVQQEKKDPEQVIEALYLRALSRKPTAEEMSTLRAMLPQQGDHSKGEGMQETVRVLEDVFWALLNSEEFMFNH